MEDERDEFVQLLTASQPAIYACILSLVPNRALAQDVLQETNLTLWRKANQFIPGSSFFAWASRIARYHVLELRRKQRRDLLIFDEELFDELAARQAARVEDVHQFTEPLRRCLDRLPKQHRELLAERYGPGGAVSKIAQARGQTVGAISQMLYRIREALLNCVAQRLQEGGS